MATRNAIARLRREAGLSQYRLAVMVGVTEKTVWNWERRGDSRREVRGGQAAREGAGRAHGGSGGRGMTGSRMTRALLASAVVMDAAGWMCAAQGAYGLARVCFSAALPFIAAWALASLRG